MDHTSVRASEGRRAADLQKPSLMEQVNTGTASLGLHLPITDSSTPVLHESPRVRILDEAKRVVTKDRNADYGDPEDNFRQIAALWAAYKQVPFTSADVAIMSALIKVARLAKTPGHHDSCVDIAGYAACLGDIQEGMRNNLAARQQASHP